MANLTVRGQYEGAMRAVGEQRFSQALAHCRRVLAVYPRHIGTYRVLGQLYLEVGRYHEAADLMRRVLSADPENTVAYAGLGAIYEARGFYDEAIWQLERALELSPRNAALRTSLRRLYAARQVQYYAELPAPGTSDGAVSAASRRIKMTRGALARTYLRAQLLPKAIGELRDLVAGEPHRLDLRVALAEALWRDGRLIDAEAVCHGILAELPNCLKASLILGRIWLHTEQDDKARELLQRAQALDPENAVAQSLFGSDSPLPARVARLPFVPDEGEAEPLELPYLMDDAEVVASSPVIDGSARSARPSLLGLESLDGRALTMLGVDSVGDAARAHDRDVTEEQATESPADVAEESPADDDYPCPDGATPLDVQVQQVECNPDDTLARLRLARLLSQIGDIDAALLHYGVLVSGKRALRQVGRELDALCLIWPGYPGLATLCLDVRQEMAEAS